MLAFSFFPRKLTAWFRMNTSHQKYICEPLPSSRACTQSHFAVLCPKRSYAARPFSKSLKFSLSLKGLCSYLEVLRERERANCCGHRTLMHFACVSWKSVSDSIPRRAGVADSNVVLGSVCKWDARVELWEEFQIQNPPGTDVGQNQQD